MSTSSRLLSLAAGTILETGPADAVSVAATAGWPAVGIWFDPATWTDDTTRQVRRRLDDTGVIALDMEPIILGPDGDPGEAVIDAAVAIGARHVLVASRVADLAVVTDRFAVLCDRAGQGNLVLALEFLPIFGVRTLTDACHVVQAAGRTNGAVLVDTLHLARSGGSPADLQALPPALLPYLQIADAPAAPPDGSLPGLVEEALHGRLLPGDGALPIAAVLEAVPEVPLSFELRSRALRDRYPDAVDRARAVLASWQPFIEA